MTPAPRAADVPPLLPDTLRALDHRLAVGQAEGRSPSMVGTVVRGDGVVWHGGRGTVDGAVDGAAPDADTQYRIGSITKTFVAVLVLRLREQGRLDLDDRVATHLPDLPAGPADATVAEVLAHSSGLTAETAGPWWERSPGTERPGLGDVWRDPVVLAGPGRRHHYSNTGYAVLGALVERCHGRGWLDVLRTDVLDPLGLHRTTAMPSAPHASGWAVHPWADLVLPEPAEDAGLLGPAGQLWSTTTDLARYAAFLLHGDDRVLPAAVVAEMRTPSAPPDPGGWDRGHGLGLQLLRVPATPQTAPRVLAGHTGSMPGFLATLWCDPEQDLAAVVCANATSGPAVSAIVADLLGTVAAREPRIPGPWRPVAADPAAFAVAGPWYWGAAPLALRVVGRDELRLDGLGGPARTSRFRPAGPDRWVGLDGYYAGERLRVVRDAAGGVDHLDVAGFVLTRGPYDPAGPVPGGVDPGGWRA